MERKNFIRRIEDFVCEHCQAQVQGSGYTNHCPQCLWSKHVDVVPGDRAAGCNGLMRPRGVIIEGGLPSQIMHQCEACGHRSRSRVAEQDNFELIATLPTDI